jgi:anthranilate synthase component 2
MERILVLDNYDSFTYNLVHYVEDITGAKVDVFRNNMITVEEAGYYDRIILSPGPGLPEDAGIMPALLKKYIPGKKILGICLGHQAIVQSLGGSLYNLDKVYHGVSTKITIDTSQKIFSKLQPSIEAGRYHSWAVHRDDLPACLEIIASDEAGVIMGVKHRQFDVTGVQFHPESILTPQGHAMIKNWLS